MSRIAKFRADNKLFLYETVTNLLI